jgi:hypothetical protein
MTHKSVRRATYPEIGLLPVGFELGRGHWGADTDRRGSRNSTEAGFDTPATRSAGHPNIAETLLLPNVSYGCLTPLRSVRPQPMGALVVGRVVVPAEPSVCRSGWWWGRLDALR